jgi:hypothetical protein
MHAMSLAAIRDLDAPDPSREAFAHAVARAKADFLEMPGLTINVPQASRLWAYPPEYCDAILTELVRQGFVVRVRGAFFARP